MQAENQLHPSYFLWDIEKIWQDCNLGTLGVPGFGHPNWDYQLVEYFHCYLHAKNKLKCQNFSKSPKTLFWGHFRPLFSKFEEEWVFLEKRALSVFIYSNYLPSCKKIRKKTIDPFLRKSWSDGQTDRTTDKQRWGLYFRGTFRGTGVQKCYDHFYC